MSHLAQLLRLLLGVGHEDLLQVAEILRAGLVALLGRGLSAYMSHMSMVGSREVPSAEVGIALLGAPQDRLGAEHVQGS